MTSKERYLRALEGREVDVLPIHGGFAGRWLEPWRKVNGLPPVPTEHFSEGVPDIGRLSSRDNDACRYYGIDGWVVASTEGPWPTGARQLPPDGEYQRSVDHWGSVVRTQLGAQGILLESPRMPAEDHDVDVLEFESADLDSRHVGFAQQVAEAKADDRCIFAKVGGPFLRTTLIRGFEQWLIDLLDAPDFATELAGRVGDHLADVGVELLRRGDLYDTGIWIFDDMAHNLGTLFSPRTFEHVFLPAYARMISRFKEAGARWVFLHCDGNLWPILPQLVEAGIEGLNPIEYKAGMRVSELRERFGDRLRYVGGLDNAHIVPSGTDEEVERHVRETVALARDGGFVIGAGADSDVGIERYERVVEAIRPGYVPPTRALVAAADR